MSSALLVLLEVVVDRVVAPQVVAPRVARVVVRVAHLPTPTRVAHHPTPTQLARVAHHQVEVTPTVMAALDRIQI